MAGSPPVFGCSNTGAPAYVRSCFVRSYIVTAIWEYTSKYTPNCFESMTVSTFEDQLFPVCRVETSLLCRCCDFHIKSMYKGLVGNLFWFIASSVSSIDVNPSIQTKSIDITLGCTAQAFTTTCTNAQTHDKPVFESTAKAFRLHFASLHLSSTDDVVIRMVNNVTMQLSRFYPSGVAYTNVYSPRLFTKLLHVEIARGQFSRNTDHTTLRSYCRSTNSNHENSTHVHDCFGLALDTYQVFTNLNLFVRKASTFDEQAGCGVIDTMKHVVCMYNRASIVTNPYTFSRPVMRILVRKDNGEMHTCTGWLWGSDGHFMTANHCISTCSCCSDDGTDHPRRYIYL